MFTVDRPTCVRDRLSAFRVVYWFSAPAGRCSTVLMLSCILVSKGSSQSLINYMRAAFAVLVGTEHLIKLFCDFRLGTTPRCPLSGCLLSVYRVHSIRLVIVLLVYGGVISASRDTLLVCVCFRQHLMTRQVSFSVAPYRQAYYAAE